MKLDDGKIYLIDEESVKDLGIIQGKKISKAILEELVIRNEINRGKKYCLFILSHRDFTKFEIKKKLEKKDFSEESILKIIKWLEEEKYLNDESFAYEWAQYQMRNKPIGRFRLNHKLKEKGIENAIREKVVNDMFKNISEENFARKIVHQKIDHHNFGYSKNESKKIYNLLIRRGFPSDIAGDIFFELINKEFK